VAVASIEDADAMADALKRASGAFLLNPPPVSGEQLDANLAALDVTLSVDQIASLDALTQPTLNFPADLLRNLSLNLAHAGATVNGEASTRLASLLPAMQAKSTNPANGFHGLGAISSWSDNVTRAGLLRRSGCRSWAPVAAKADPHLEG
jgi:hypothetical protein